MSKLKLRLAMPGEILSVDMMQADTCSFCEGPHGAQSVMMLAPPTPVALNFCGMECAKKYVTKEHSEGHAFPVYALIAQGHRIPSMKEISDELAAVFHQGKAPTKGNDWLYLLPEVPVPPGLVQ